MIRPTDYSRAGPVGARALCLLLAAILVFQLFYLGAQPYAADLVPPPWDKVAHLAAYSAIAALLCLGTAACTPMLVIVAVIAVGAADELRQVDLPGRSADLLDFLVDACAASGTVMLFRAAKR